MVPAMGRRMPYIRVSGISIPEYLFSRKYDRTEQQTGSSQKQDLCSEKRSAARGQQTLTRELQATRSNVWEASSMLQTARNGQCRANREQPAVSDKDQRGRRRELREASNKQRAAEQQSVWSVW